MDKQAELNVKRLSRGMPSPRQYGPPSTFATPLGSGGAAGAPEDKTKKPNPIHGKGKKDIVQAHKNL